MTAYVYGVCVCMYVCVLCVFMCANAKAYMLRSEDDLVCWTLPSILLE